MTPTPAQAAALADALYAERLRRHVWPAWLDESTDLKVPLTAREAQPAFIDRSKIRPPVRPIVFVHHEVARYLSMHESLRD